jgi:hypothetical protein
MLIAATDAWCDSVPDSVNDETGEKMELRRIECHPDGINLNGESHALAFTILSRALWNLQHMKPDLVKKISRVWRPLPRASRRHVHQIQLE